MEEKKKFTPKKKKEKQKKMLLKLSILIVGVTMVTSALLYGNYTPQHPQQIPNPIDVFSNLDLKSSGITFYVENFSDEYAFFSNRPFDRDTLNYLKNKSIDGVEKIEITYIKNKYFLFIFKLNTTNCTKEEALNNIFSELEYTLNMENKENLLGIYNGYIYGTGKRFKIFGPVKMDAGDFGNGEWYIMTSNKTTENTENIALISRIIEKCENMSGIVKNITSINVDGTTYDVDILKKLNIKAENIQTIKPSVELNDTNVVRNLMKRHNYTITTDNNISTIDFGKWTIKVKNLTSNITIISFEFNATKEEMEKILNESKAKYVLKAGKLTFKINGDEWNEEIYEKIRKNLGNLTIQKEGSVILYNLCVYNKKLVPISMHDRFNAIMNLKRNINDTINVNVNLYSITGGGEDRYVPYLAVDNEM